MDQQKSDRSVQGDKTVRYINPVIDGREITFSKIDGTSVFISPYTKRPVSIKLPDPKEPKEKQETIESTYSEIWIG